MTTQPDPLAVDDIINHRHTGDGREDSAGIYPSMYCTSIIVITLFSETGSTVDCKIRGCALAYRQTDR